MVCFTLKNRENILVASAIIENNNIEEMTNDELDEMFNDKIVEYVWDEDQSLQNAITILKELLFLITDDINLDIGMVYEYNDMVQRYCYQLVSNNCFRNATNQKNNVIITPFPISISDCTRYFEKACENIQEQY